MNRGFLDVDRLLAALVEQMIPFYTYSSKIRKMI